MQTIRRCGLQNLIRSNNESDFNGAKGAIMPIVAAMERSPSSFPALCVQICSIFTASHVQAEGMGGLSSGPAEIFDR